MKFNFYRILLPLLFSLFLVACSDDEATFDPTAGLVKITDGYALGAGAKVELWAESDLFAGYNNIYLALYDSISGKRITDSHIHLNPVMDMGTMSHSCPAEEPAEDAVNELFPAAIMFTMPSGDMGSWKLEVKVHNHESGLFGTAVFDITVQSVTPSAVLSFQAASGKRYYFGYQFAEPLKVGVNTFGVVAYTYLEGEFVPAEGLTIHLTPEMPSMDHGSPNNEDPIHTGNGHYTGKANFTMTGEWRLNLDIADGETSLGTKYFDVVVK